MAPCVQSRDAVAASDDGHRARDSLRAHQLPAIASRRRCEVVRRYGYKRVALQLPRPLPLKRISMRV